MWPEVTRSDLEVTGSYPEDVIPREATWKWQ